MRKNELTWQYRQMQLKSISLAAGAGKNYCMINDAVLCQGDYIKDFRVAKIGPDFVELFAEDTKFVLKISSD